MRMYMDHRGLEDIGKIERESDFVRPVLFVLSGCGKVAESISILSENIEKRLKMRYIRSIYGEK